MDKVTGVVESKSRKGNGIKVNGEWYSTYSAADLNHIEWKDSVEFLYEQKGKYRNIKGKVEKTASGGGAPSGTRSLPASGGGGYSSIGVELGHAANLAMRMMEQAAAESERVGSPEYYKQFVTYTTDMYKVMKAIRAKVESGDISAAPPPPPAAPEPDVADGDLDDLF